MAGACDEKDQSLKKVYWSKQMVSYASNIDFLLYNTDRTETTSICQLDYADLEKIIPKLIKALHRKILPF